MTLLICAFLLAPALFTLYVLVYSLVQIQMAEPIEMVTLDRVSVMRKLLAKSAGAALMLSALVLIGCDSKPPYNPWDYVTPTVGANIQFPSSKVRCIVPDGIASSLASGGKVVLKMAPQYESASYRVGRNYWVPADKLEEFVHRGFVNIDSPENCVKSENAPEAAKPRPFDPTKLPKVTDEPLKGFAPGFCPMNPSDAEKKTCHEYLSSSKDVMDCVDHTVSNDGRYLPPQERLDFCKNVKWDKGPR